MTKGTQVSLLIDNGKGRVLLQLRDDKDCIPFPNCWSTFGGAVEEGETPLEAVKREIKEELDLDIDNPEFVDVYNHDGYDVHLFRLVDKRINPASLNVLEGQMAALISKKEMLSLPFGFNLDLLLLDYFSRYYEE